MCCSRQKFDLLVKCRHVSPNYIVIIINNRPNTSVALIHITMHIVIVLLFELNVTY